MVRISVRPFLNIHILDGEDDLGFHQVYLQDYGVKVKYRQGSCMYSVFKDYLDRHKLYMDRDSKYTFDAGIEMLPYYEEFYTDLIEVLNEKQLEWTLE